MVLSINGSDSEEEFPETDNNEPEQIYSRDSDSDSHEVHVASKVEKINTMNRTDKFNHLCDDPNFKAFWKEMVNDEVKALKHSSRRKSAKSLGTADGGTFEMVATPSRVVHQVNNVKSLSDTTIYKPALRKMSANNDDAVVDKIANFVESI